MNDKPIIFKGKKSDIKFLYQRGLGFIGITNNDVCYVDLTKKNIILTKDDWDNLQLDNIYNIYIWTVEALKIFYLTPIKNQPTIKHIYKKNMKFIKELEKVRRRRYNLDNILEK